MGDLTDFEDYSDTEIPNLSLIHTNPHEAKELHIPFYSSIDEYNKYLSDSLIKIELIEYFNKIHHIFYNDEDISFMEYFLSICNHKNEFIINQEKLKEYKIINNIENSNNIKKTLDLHNLEKDIDYRVRNVSQPVKQGGFSIKNIYEITPKAFKICLIRSKNTKKFANYYLKLEEIFDAYIKYELMFKDKLLSMNNTVLFFLGFSIFLYDLEI